MERRKPHSENDFAQQTILEWGLAFHAVYPARRGRPVLRLRPAAEPPGPEGLQALLPGRHLAGPAVHRLLASRLALLRLPAPQTRSQPRDGAQGAARQPPRTRRAG